MNTAPATGAPTVAIVADDLLQRQRLRQALGKYGITVVFTGSAGDYLARAASETASLVIIELQDDHSSPELLDQLLAQTDSALLFSPGPAPSQQGPEYVRWERRLFNKLQQQCGDLESLDDKASLNELVAQEKTPPLHCPPRIATVAAGAPATMVWVLGASLGGPAAVKAFLDRLPPGLPLAFVYAQHIDYRVAPLLQRVLTRHAHYPLVAPQAGAALRCGEVLQVPVQHQITLNKDGSQKLTDRPWQGPHGPSIDQVIQTMADHYGSQCHSILFSGMGNDGSLAAPQLKALGSQLWVQTPDSCASPAMVESAMATGAVTYSGDPGELAAQLLRWLEGQSLLQARQQRHRLADHPKGSYPLVDRPQAGQEGEAP
ncbi:MAG: chemotaxis protein CheB [Halomonadaceae bacterium]|nr:MAG: chemotaxis protein CheB [Halomonadaceae bacterium]